MAALHVGVGGNDRLHLKVGGAEHDKVEGGDEDEPHAQVAGKHGHEQVGLHFLTLQNEDEWREQNARTTPGEYKNKKIREKMNRATFL